MSKFEEGFGLVKKAVKVGALTGLVGTGSIIGMEQAQAQAQAENPLKNNQLKTEINNDSEKNIDKKEKILNPDDYDLKKICQLDETDLKGKKSLDKSVMNRILTESLIKKELYNEFNHLDTAMNVIENKLNLVHAEIDNLKEKGQDINSELNQELLNFRNELHKLSDKLEENRNNRKLVNDSQYDKVSLKIDEDDKKYLKEAPKIFGAIEGAREEIRREISAPAYLKKLEVEFGDQQLALKHQRVRLSNLEVINYELPSLKALKNSSSYDVGAYTIDNSNVIVLPYDINIETIKKFALHEFRHAITNSQNGLSGQTAKLLTDGYYNDSGTDKRTAEYQSQAAERYVRFESLKSEMIKLGVMKAGEEFTQEHYKKMIELCSQNKFSRDADQFIMFSKGYDTQKGFEIFKELFDKIAFLDKSKDNKIYKHPGWNYEAPEGEA